MLQHVQRQQVAAGSKQTNQSMNRMITRAGDPAFWVCVFIFTALQWQISSTFVIFLIYMGNQPWPWEHSNLAYT